MRIITIASRSALAAVVFLLTGASARRLACYEATR
jgi:hypothetical protein